MTLPTLADRHIKGKGPHLPDRRFIEHLDDFFLDFRDGLRERLENRVVSPSPRETVKGALESNSNDREHDALVLVAEELSIDWTGQEDPNSV